MGPHMMICTEIPGGPKGSVLVGTGVPPRAPLPCGLIKWSTAQPQPLHSIPGGPWAVGDQSLPVIDLSSLECWAGGSANTWLAELLRGRQLRNPMVGKVGLGQDPMRQLPSPCSLSAAPPIRPVWANSSSPSLPGPASGQTMG